MSLQTRLAALVATALLSALPLAAAAQGLTSSSIAQARAAGILDDKAARTPAERKLAAQLLFAHRAMGKGARRHTVTPGVPGFVQKFIDAETDANLAVYVSIDASPTRELAAWLAGVGATQVHEFAREATVTAVVPVSELLALADRPEVTRVAGRSFFRTHRIRPALDARRQAIADALKPRTNTGAVTWQGVTAHRADLAHAAGITGAGVKVCVISDGVDSLAPRQAAGELPAVDVLPTQEGAGDEGTAMLEIIADMAPGAALGFATGTNSQASFANNIRTLQSSSGCHVIVDGVTWFDEPAFNDGIIANAVNDVTAAGVIYLSSAGDGSNLTNTYTSTYEADFVPSATPMPPPISTIEGGVGSLHQFPGGPYTTFAASPTNNGRTNLVTLQWSDASNTSVNDYDLFVMDSTGSTILGSGIHFQGPGGGFGPFEQASCDVTREELSPDNSVPSPCDYDSSHTCSASTQHAFCLFPVNARIYVVRSSGALRAIRLDATIGILADRTAGSAYGHNAAANAITVGSTSLLDVAGSNSFTAQNRIETYSSDGPRKIFYANNSGVITPITPGNFLFGTNGGTTLPKIDLAAGDCGATSTPDFDLFCGASAAAPAAAAIAALVKSAKPTATRAQITAALAGSAIDIEQAGHDRDSGAGIVMAPQAVAGILLPLTYTKGFSPSAITAGGTSTLTITIGNPNAITIFGAAFNDVYPAHVVNAGSPNPSLSGAGCTGSLSANPGGNSFSAVNAVIPAGGTCTFTVVVTTTTGGFHTDSSGTATTPIGLNTNSPAATLTVDAPAVQRAFVSATGNDANTFTNCGFANPCRSFAAAQLVLLPGGEMIALKAGGYGAITINKSVGIIANPGVHANLSPASPGGYAITVATPGVNVLLRGVNINAAGGAHGIYMTAGASLTIQNSVIANASSTGVWFDAPGVMYVANSLVMNNAIGLAVVQGKADVVHSRAYNNSLYGFSVGPPDGGTASLSIVDSFASGNGFGFAASAPNGATARLTVTRSSGVSNTDAGLYTNVGSSGTGTAVVAGSMFSNNGIGMFANGGTIKSFGDNLVDLNGTNTSGTITALPGI